MSVFSANRETSMLSVSELPAGNVICMAKSPSSNVGMTPHPAGEKKQGAYQCGKGYDDGTPFVMQAEAQAVLVYFVQLFGRSGRPVSVSLQYGVSGRAMHHRHIGQRQDNAPMIQKTRVLAIGV